MNALVKEFSWAGLFAMFDDVIEAVENLEGLDSGAAKKACAIEIGRMMRANFCHFRISMNQFKKVMDNRNKTIQGAQDLRPANCIKKKS